jgi:hypothetical protein
VQEDAYRGDPAALGGGGRQWAWGRRRRRTTPCRPPTTTPRRRRLLPQARDKQMTASRVVNTQTVRTLARPRRLSEVATYDEASKQHLPGPTASAHLRDEGGRRRARAKRRGRARAGWERTGSAALGRDARQLVPLSSADVQARSRDRPMCICRLRWRRTR